MEEILFGSENQEIDVNFSFSDHSLSSDEDLLPIDCYKSIDKTIDKTIDSNKTIDLKNDKNVVQNSDNNKIVENISKYFMKINAKSDSNLKTNEANNENIKNESIVDNKRTNCSNYYKECPLCKSLGPKSINHIKLCANKRSIDPKQVIHLLSKCQKSDYQTIETNKKSFKKSNKLINNYIISFDDKKHLKLSINQKFINNKNYEKLYELSALDPKEKQKLLELKINQIICYKDFENSIEKKNNCFERILPNIWKLCSIDSNSNEYFVEGFENYITN